MLNAIMEVEELAGRKILDGETILTPQKGDVGVDFLKVIKVGGRKRPSSDMLLCSAQTIPRKVKMESNTSGGSMVFDVGSLYAYLQGMQDKRKPRGI
ncbi:MAG TPA: hypothetical protein VLT84_11765, partial [Acidobacteriota bacterium]|nr:hypothetical protein [Acidobacteriota bacterium]